MAVGVAEWTLETLATSSTQRALMKCFIYPDLYENELL
jgi:hypothetical protein